MGGLGFGEAGCRYFDFAVLTYLTDVAGNVSDGVHVGSSTGRGWRWCSALGASETSTAGSRSTLGCPRASMRWFLAAGPGPTGQGQVKLAHDEELYLLDEGDPLEITIRGHAHTRRRGPGDDVPQRTRGRAVGGWPRPARQGLLTGPPVTSRRPVSIERRRPPSFVHSGVTAATSSSTRGRSDGSLER